MSLFRRRLLMSQSNVSTFPNIDGLIARYSARGLTNEQMSENPILKDLSGNGHDITLHNFAWGGMSGIGGYPEPAKIWNSNLESVIKTILKTDSEVSFELIKASSSNSSIAYLYIYREDGNLLYNGNDIVLKAGEYGLKLYKAKKGGTGSEVISTAEPNETVVVSKEDIQSYIEQGYPILMFGSSMAVPANGIFTTYVPPLHKGALVSDGVDDYGICENFPILTKEEGYTVVAVRKWITQDNQGAVVSKNTANTQTGAFLFEGETTSNRFIGSFGNFKYVNSFADSLFTYQTSTKYGSDVEFTLTSDKVDETNLLAIFSYYNNDYARYCRCSIALYDLLIYSRDLTEEEIGKIKTYFAKIHPDLSIN